MQGVVQKINSKYQKSQVVDVKSGDTVKVHQKVVEGGKSRIQIFEGLVIKTGRQNSLSSTFTVRRIASGVGVEKSYLIHSPNIVKVEVTKRSKVRRNYLSYMRNLTGKSARLSGVDFDKKAVNTIKEPVSQEPKKADKTESEQSPAEPTVAPKPEVEAVVDATEQPSPEPSSEDTPKDNRSA